MTENSDSIDRRVVDLYLRMIDACRRNANAHRLTELVDENGEISSADRDLMDQFLMVALGFGRSALRGVMAEGDGRQLELIIRATYPFASGASGLDFDTYHRRVEAIVAGDHTGLEFADILTYLAIHAYFGPDDATMRYQIEGVGPDLIREMRRSREKSREN